MVLNHFSTTDSSSSDARWISFPVLSRFSLLLEPRRCLCLRTLCCSWSLNQKKTGNQLIEAQAVCKQHYKLHTCLFYWAFSVGSCLVFVSLLNCCCIRLITWCSYVASLRKSGGFQHRSDIFLWYALCKCPVSPSLCVFCVSVLCLLSSSYLFFETVLSYLLG